MRSPADHVSWFCALLLAGFTAAGCGGSGSQDASDGGVSFQPIVEAKCEWDTRCGRGDCYRQICSAPILRAEAVAAAVRCYKTLACDEDTDLCEELAAYNQVSNARQDIDSCLKRYRASCSSYTDIDAGLCLGYPLLIPSKRAEFDQCFEQGTCAEPCLMAVEALCTPQE